LDSRIDEMGTRIDEMGTRMDVIAPALMKPAPPRQFCQPIRRQIRRTFRPAGRIIEEVAGLKVK